MDQQRILIVDDERFNVNVLVDLLRDDYKMMVAKNGEQALKAIELQLPDMVLLDIMMPGMDGYEVCRRLKSDDRTRDIPVIFVSAMGQELDEQKGFELGAVDYITKPICPSIVLARVKTHLELRNAYKVIERQKNRMQEELDVGHRLQLSMLSTKFPEHPDISLFAALRPAKEMSGDFYDFYFVDDEHICFCVGDVSGKGVPAALFMAQTKILLKSYSLDVKAIAEIITHVNNMLSEENDAGMFVTLFFACLNIKTGVVDYVNAGHQPPLIVRKDGEIERMSNPEDLILGVVPEYQYHGMKMELAKGDSIFIYTDGITEAVDAQCEMYEESRLIKLLDKSRSLEPKKLVEKIITEVDDFAGEAAQFDDITVMVLSRNS
jgi:sigma-B regulation protein RsbU (phosphoserine phosphatase)